MTRDVPHAGSMGQPVEGLGSIEQRSSCDWIKVVSQHIDPALYGRAPGKTGRLGKDRPLACPVCGPSVAPTASPHRGAAPRSIGRGEPARVRAWGRPPRAGGGGAGTRRSGRAHADATHAEGRVGKLTAGGEDSRAPTPTFLATLTLPPLAQPPTALPRGQPSLSRWSWVPGWAAQQ